MTDLEKELENKEILRKYRSLLRACRPYISKEDRKTIRKAFDMSMEAHEGMRRRSGEPYIYHPLAVARILADEIGVGSTSIVCALLHDVVEDTDITLEDIESEFGPKRARIIDGLTKITKVQPHSKSLQADNFRKILLTLAEDVRVILIKVADRLHNMRTLDSMPKQKQLKVASETLYLYVPLAHRLGLYNIKSELEDLSLKYTEPDIYESISQKMKETEKERNQYIKNFIRPLREELKKQGFNFRIYGRTKSISSVWNKMKSKGVKFENVYDIFAIRIILDSPPETEKEECWRTYSLVTDIYQPNPDRLRDWISMPKVNGYEALHTTVMGPKGNWVEVQIRSERMNAVAEKGIAAHWKYKENSSDGALDEWLKKIREVLENPELDSIQFLDEIKLNLYSDQIFVFTPKGQLVVLPMGATVLDFAYEIHTDIGEKCIGAKANHKLVPLDYQLKNGDQVEILTSNVQHPTEEWLNYVVTSKAKSKIKSVISKERRAIAKKGKAILEKKFKSIKVTVNRTNILALMRFYDKKNESDFYYDIGTGTIDFSALEYFKIKNGKIVIQRPKDGEIEGELDFRIKSALQQNANILIFGDNKEDIDYHFAKCCNPIPGDEVVALLKEEGELEIHKTNCDKAIELMSKYGNKIVKTKWSRSRGISFLVGIKIEGLDVPGVMYEITKIISHDLKMNMQSITIEGRSGNFEAKLNVFVHETTELEKLMEQLLSLEFILNVEQI